MTRTGPACPEGRRSRRHRTGCGTGPGRLDRLIATRETVGNVLLLAGPGLGGLLVAILGLAPALMLITATTSLLAAAITLLLDPRTGRVPLRERSVSGAGGALRRAGADLLVSWRFLGSNRLVLGATLISASLIAVLSSLQSTLMPAYFTAQGLPGLTGLTLSAIAAGSIAGSALFAATASRVRRRTWFVIGMVGTLVGFAAVGTMASPWVVLGGAALVGLTNAPAGAVLGILVVEATPDEMRGRGLGAQNTVMLAAPALTSAPLAAVAAIAGLPVAGAVLAVLAGVTAIIALIAPAFRNLDERPAEASSPHPVIGIVGAGPSSVDVDPEHRAEDQRAGVAQVSLLTVPRRTGVHAAAATAGPGASTPRRP